jgi:hypothetical protein
MKKMFYIVSLLFILIGTTNAYDRICIDSIDNYYLSHTNNTISYDIYTQGWYKIQLIDVDNKIYKEEFLQKNTDSTIIKKSYFTFNLSQLLQVNQFKLKFEYYEFGVWKPFLESSYFTITNGVCFITKPDSTIPLNYYSDYLVEAFVENPNLPLSIYTLQNNEYNRLGNLNATGTTLRREVLKLTRNSPTIQICLVYGVDYKDSIFTTTPPYSSGYSNIEFLVDSLHNEIRYKSDTLALYKDINMVLFDSIVVLNKRCIEYDSVLIWMKNNPQIVHDTTNLILVISDVTGIISKEDESNLTNVKIINNVIYLDNCDNEIIKHYLFDMTGKLINSTTEKYTPIDISYLSPGVYLLYVRDKGLYKVIR